MNLLFEIYNKIVLNETVSVNSVTDSINNRYRVTINYEGDPSHGIAPGPRTIEVYAYGLTSSGNPVIRAYQPYGDTASKVPSWKFFRLDRVKSWKATYSLVTKPAPGFNPDGDGSMSTVYSIANFNNDTNLDNKTGPKQTFKQVGTLDNFDKVTADRDRERKNKTEYNKIVNNQNQPEQPNVDNTPYIKNNNIPEPKIDGIDNTTSSVSDNAINNVLGTDQTLYKTKGEEELDKVKDLNRRLDNARKIDLNTYNKK